MRGERLAMRLGTVVAVLAIAPITIFALATVGRLLQPLPSEPAGTEERIYQWFVALPAAAIVILLIALPVLALVTAAAVAVAQLAYRPRPADGYPPSRRPRLALPPTSDGMAVRGRRSRRRTPRHRHRHPRHHRVEQPSEATDSRSAVEPPGGR